MRNILLALLSMISLSTKSQQSPPADNQSSRDSAIIRPIVRITSGLIRGVSDGNVVVFKGIPYAAPPVGEFRWRPPQPVKKWKGVREADQFGSDCAQSGWGNNTGKIANGSSEDCLYLNVWKPSKPQGNSTLPVMVWIHGGGFTGGSGASPQNFGNEFCNKGVILVTINYRLGRLGFFAFPSLSKEHPEEFKGNYGYMDQIAALQWVQKNITAFGGDPENVTIFGFSAGGVSVHSLLTIPSAKGLFHKAISESGGGRDGVLTGRPLRTENTDSLYPVSAETIGINFARKHKIETSDAAALATLRSLSVEEIVDRGREIDSSGLRIYPGPILDGKLVVETAESAYGAGRQVQVPLMIGNCSAEIGGPFVSNATTKNTLFAKFGALEGEAQAAFDPEGTKEFAEVQTLFNTDWVWGEPARMTANAFVAKGNPVFMYQFSYVPVAARQQSRYGAGHGSEVSFVFNTLNARWGAPVAATDQEKALAKIMNTYWTNFAKTGNPNGNGLPVWTGYSIQKQEILDIDMDGNPVSKPDPRKSRFDVIEKAFKKRHVLQFRGI